MERPLAVKFAATHPHNLIGVILSAGFISNPVVGGDFCPDCWLIRCFFDCGRRLCTRVLSDRWADAPDSLKLAVRNAVLVFPPEILAARAREVLTCDARQEIVQVKVPLLYLQGTEDRLIGKESLEEIKRLHPQTVSVSLRDTARVVAEQTA